jgi:predicted Zn-dependent protease
LHLHFFQALVALQGQPRDAGARAALETALHTASDRNVVRDKELRADMNGIMYAAMAGFNPRAIVTEGPNTNFFADWVRELEQQSLRSISINHLSPTPQERAEAVRARLRPVADNTPVFQVGSGSITRGITHEPCKRLRTSGRCSPVARYSITWRRVTISWPCRRTRPGSRMPPSPFSCL